MISRIIGSRTVVPPSSPRSPGTRWRVAISADGTTKLAVVEPARADCERTASVRIVRTRFRKRRRTTRSPPIEAVRSRSTHRPRPATPTRTRWTTTLRRPSLAPPTRSTTSPRTTLILRRETWRTGCWPRKT